MTTKKETEYFGIGKAVKLLRLGHRVCRKNWNGKGMWLGIQEVNDTSDMTQPYIYMKTVQGDLVPWLASQTDILGIDWMLIER